MPFLRADLLPSLLTLAGVLLAYAGARRWMGITRDLDIGLFRPWRGDPWPVGVQEDDDFRFNWAERSVAAAPAREDDADQAGEFVIEDLETGGAVPHPVDRVSIHPLA